MFKISFTALLLSAAAPALAGQSSQTVNYGDLNLSSPAGAAAFQSRIDRAVRQICGSAHASDLNGQAQVRRCRSDSIAGVAARRDAVLAAANSPRTGGLAASGTR